MQKMPEKGKKETIMAILREGFENVKGAFKVLMGSAIAVGAMDMLKKIIEDKGVEAGIDFIRVLASGKGLTNEAVYGYIMAACDLKTAERMLLIRAIEELRLGTEKEKQAADNFVIIVALADPDDKTKRRPGEKIIHGFIHRIYEYPTDDEKLRMIKDNVIHIGTDAETKTKIAVAQKWAIETALPAIWEAIDGTANSLGNGLNDVTGWIKKQYDDRDARVKAWHAMPWKERLRPGNLWTRFNDLF